MLLSSHKESVTSRLKWVWQVLRSANYCNLNVLNSSRHISTERFVRFAGWAKRGKTQCLKPAIGIQLSEFDTDDCQDCKISSSVEKSIAR